MPPDSNQDLKSCATIRLKEGDPCNSSGKSLTVGPFRNQIAFRILEEVASGLRELKYDVGPTKRGKACDAVVRCRVSELSLTLVLVAQIGLNVEQPEFHLRIQRSRTLGNMLWFRSLAIPAHLSHEWNRFCATVDQRLQEMAHVNSVDWHTRHEAEIQWSKRF
jgi:hypothetical protein